MNKTVSFSKNAVNVFFHILTACNLKCAHCYINPEQHGRTTLPLSLIKEWLSAFSDKTKDANVIFLGGEPTLHPDLPEAIRFARSIGYKSITVDTNGYLFNDFLSRVNPPDLDFLSFSLDGATKETNDRLRGEGCYDACTKGIKTAVKKGFSTSLIFTVSRANIHELELMPDLVRELGIKHFFIQVIGIRGEAAHDGKETTQISRDEWIKKIPPVAEKTSKYGIKVTYPKVFLEPDDEFECAGTEAENYFIFPNGRVYRCPLCEDFAINALEFREGKLEKMSPLNEDNFFSLSIPEGCVMNKMIQPGNIEYSSDRKPVVRIACCLIKKEVGPLSE